MDAGNATAVERLMSAFQEAGCRPPVLVLGAEAEALRRRLPEGVAERCLRLVVNTQWEAGRTGSLQAGLAAAADAAGEASDFLIAPVDHPFVAAGTIREMLGALENGRASGARVVIPVHGGRSGHPVLCDGRLRGEFSRLRAGEPASRVTSRIPGRVLRLATEDPAVLDDLDTPADLQRARARVAAGAVR